MINFNNKESLIEYLKSEINFEPSIGIIVTESFVSEIISEIEADAKTVTSEIDKDYYLYLVEKEASDNGDFYLNIEPIEYNSEGIMANTVYSEIIILQDGLLEEVDTDLFACEELRVVDYSDDSDQCNCPDCTRQRELEKLQEQEANCNHACENCCGCDCQEETEENYNDEFDIQEEIISAKLEFVSEILEDFGEVDIIVNYETAKAIVEEYSIQNYENDFSIQLHSDVENYIISIEQNSVFICEPLEREGGYFHIISDSLYIDSEIEKYLDSDFYEFVECDDISVFGIQEDYYENNEECDCCENCDWELMFSEYKLDDTNGQKQVCVWEENNCGNIRNIKTWNVE